MKSICGVDYHLSVQRRLQGLYRDRQPPLWGDMRHGGVQQKGRHDPGRTEGQADRGVPCAEHPGHGRGNALRGSLINLEYTLSNGQTVRVWEDDRIYLGNQLRKEGSERCYGVAADETYLMVSEYGGYGDDVQIVIFKRWKDS